MPSVTSLATDLGNIVTAVNGHADDQDTGSTGFRGGSSSRQMVARQLRAQMQPINKIGRALKPELYPTAREQFKMPGFDFTNYNRNAALHARGVPLPKATSTGTTIVGCIFDGGVVVRARSVPHCIVVMPTKPPCGCLQLPKQKLTHTLL